MEILIALLERPGEVVPKHDLISRVWPGVPVDESSLRFHLAALRKILGSDKIDARYIVNVPGRGYCFVAAVVRTTVHAAVAEDVAEPVQSNNLPRRLLRMVGRDKATIAIQTQLMMHRFVTVVGPGGVGKTSVAVAVGHNLLATFGGALRFVDLAPLSDPTLVATTVADALYIPTQSANTTTAITNFLINKRMLLLLDTCEHLIEAVAEMAERIHSRAAHVHILATSREPLRAEGERIYRLKPLPYPPVGKNLSSFEAIEFAAVQLFIDRANSTGNRLDLKDSNPSIVAEICRKLDGLPLAIEIVASRSDTYGLEQIAALLNERTTLLWRGRRTAPNRHQTLNATLNWSYDLLPEAERLLLSDLSVLVGSFNVEAACAVHVSSEHEKFDAIQGLANLVERSLLNAEIGGSLTRYRLADMTCSFASGKLAAQGRNQLAARRHAIYCLSFIERAHDDYAQFSAGEAHADYRAHVFNLRSALDWCFSESGDVDLGVLLAAASMQFFLRLLLFAECHHWAERALAISDRTDGTLTRMIDLQAGLGLSLLLGRENGDKVTSALIQALALAEMTDDRYRLLWVLGGLHLARIIMGDVSGALGYSEQAELVAVGMDDPAAADMVDCMLGACYHIRGDFERSQIHCLRVRNTPPVSSRAQILSLGFDIRAPALCALARNLWLQGLIDEARLMAATLTGAVGEAARPVPMCFNLSWITPIYLWDGEWKVAEAMIERLITVGREYSLAPYPEFGLCLKAELWMRSGKIEAGIELMLANIAQLTIRHYQVQNIGFYLALGQGLVEVGEAERALSTIDDAIRCAQSSGGTFNMPELHRLKGEIMTKLPACSASETEGWFRRALELARHQSALFWELRAATSFARVLQRQGRLGEARRILEPVYERYIVGLDSLDLRRARSLLTELA